MMMRRSVVFQGFFFARRLALAVAVRCTGASVRCARRAVALEEAPCRADGALRMSVWTSLRRRAIVCGIVRLACPTRGWR
jgi:hypothetical protein